jgi:anti-sigma factor RsiW
MTSPRSTPACRRAEELLALVVSGEARPADRAELAAHLADCPACPQTLGKTLAMATRLEETLREAADRLGTPPVLALPERERQALRRTRILVDFALLLTLGLGLFLLIALATLGYRSARSAADAARTFRAVNQVLRLTVRAERLMAGSPAPSAAELDAALARFEGPVGDGAVLDPWDRPYVVAIEVVRAAVRCRGPDGRDDAGTGDDITAQTPIPALGRFRRPR